MKNENLNPSNKNISSAIAKGMVRLFLLMVMMLLVLFLSAGKLNWWEGWAYTGQALFVLVFSRIVLLVKNPDTALERAEAGQRADVQPMDKLLLPLTAIYLPLSSWVIAGLDERFGWSPDLPDTLQIIALAVIFAGSLFGTWAMLENRFFSSHIRIQTERGHTVVSSGPYRIVRHPGYSGAVIGWIAAPVFFSSFWLAIPAVLAIIAAVIRTSLEDRMLIAELPGYREYANRVRFRFFPGIW